MRDKLIDNHTPSPGIMDMLRPEGPVCCLNIIDHLEKFSQFALEEASFNCKLNGNPTEVANQLYTALTPGSIHSICSQDNKFKTGVK